MADTFPYRHFDEWKRHMDDIRSAHDEFEVARKNLNSAQGTMMSETLGLLTGFASVPQGFGDEKAASAVRTYQLGMDRAERDFQDASERLGAASFQLQQARTRLDDFMKRTHPSYDRGQTR